MKDVLGYHIGDEVMLKGKIIKRYDDGKKMYYKVAFETEKLINDVTLSESVLLKSKVKMPRFISHIIEVHKAIPDKTLLELMAYFADSPDPNFQKWIAQASNQNRLARAWIEGYDVEEEPLYYVIDEQNRLLLKNELGEKIPVVICKKKVEASHLMYYQFTEQEIKAYDERYWAFCKAVEDVDKSI
ncbi:DUF1642 domain-containing protein [Streptococcus sp. zg-JUN1979]|uniref:DUF1642 domain-containing protein n=1 Tax=Streptococcus sp. zg-JUN1979 TaxID=3391450 RepID=UPI0039A61034